MIVKIFNIKENFLNNYSFFLFYGKNQGQKKEILNKILKNKKIYKFDEQQVLNNENEFIENTLTGSLFESEKIILIKRVTDKIIKIIDLIKERKINEIKIFLETDILEKKSKLRNFFETEKSFACIAFYPDNEETLSTITRNFLKLKSISLSSENINLIINKCRNDRGILIDELKKIELFYKSGKPLNKENLSKLINLFENHTVLELADNCLAKNKKKIIDIFNENNFTNDDCILILRTLLNKSKKTLSLVINYEQNKNIEKTISSAKPPIFWKDKNITKKQILSWNSKKIKNYLFKLNELELTVKKNSNNSLNLISDFILN